MERLNAPLYSEDVPSWRNWKFIYLDFYNPCIFLRMPFLALNVSKNDVYFNVE
jgi:hypothetical protein